MNRMNNNAIRTEDENAAEKLAAKIETITKLQGLMKDANKIVKGNFLDSVKVQKLVVLLNITEGKAQELLQPDYCGRVGFASFELTNNNANIRRLKERLQHVQKLNATEVSERMVGDIKIVENTAENRVQMFFDGKPEYEVRAKLKSAGFRWAPSNGCWQAYYNNRSKYMAEEIAKGLAPAVVEEQEEHPEPAECPAYEIQTLGGDVVRTFTPEQQEKIMEEECTPDPIHKPGMSQEQCEIETERSNSSFFRENGATERGATV